MLIPVNSASTSIVEPSSIVGNVKFDTCIELSNNPAIEPILYDPSTLFIPEAILTPEQMLRFELEGVPWTCSWSFADMIGLSTLNAPYT